MASNRRKTEKFCQNPTAHIAETSKAHGSSWSGNREEGEEEELERKKDGSISKLINVSDEQLIEDSVEVESVNDIVGRLEEVRLASEEPDLSEEQLRINSQLQEDELLALGAIYGDNVFILCREGGLRTFQVLIHVQMPDEMTITTKLHNVDEFLKVEQTAIALKGTEFVTLPCKHFFCCKCMKTYSTMHVKEGTVNKLLCPDTKCEGAIPPSLLKYLLEDEEFERWESLLLQKTLDSMSDVVYCPRCETTCIEDQDHHAQCSKCLFSFCGLCRYRRHVGETCMTPETELQILEERQNSSQLESTQKEKEKVKINEILSMKVIRHYSTQCPSCKMAISRTEGCNRMTCSYCRTLFCYECGEATKEHCRKKCGLIPREAIKEWEEWINGRQVVKPKRDEPFATDIHQCAYCGQMNVKVGNDNHIKCWSCHYHYCYLCRRLVRDSAQHFGRKGCNRHTVG